MKTQKAQPSRVRYVTTWGDAEPTEHLFHGTFWVLPLLDAWAKGPVTWRDKPLIVGILEVYLDDFQASNCLHLTWDRRTRRAYRRERPATEIPTHTQHGMASRRLRTLLDGIRVAKTEASFQARVRHMVEVLVGPLRQVFDANVALLPPIAKVIGKEEALRIAATYRVLDFAERWVDSWGWTVGGAEPQGSDEFTQGHWTDLAGSTQVILRALGASERELSEISDSGRGELGKVLRIQARGSIAKLTEALGFGVFTTPALEVVRVPLTETFAAWLSPVKHAATLDEVFMWYPREVLSSARSRIFSGSATLAPLILGQARILELHGSVERVQVIRFIHAGEPVWYSYAVLSERHGSFGSDLSGWLVFVEVGGDYAGWGGAEWKETEDAIRWASKHLVVEEVEVDARSLHQIAVQEATNVAATFHPEIADAVSVLQRWSRHQARYRDLLARFMELLVAEWLRGHNETSWGGAVRLRFKDQALLDNDEIDVLVVDEANRALVLVECQLTVRPEAVPEKAKELERKRDRITLSGSRWFGWRCRLAFALGQARREVAPQLEAAFKERGVALWMIEDVIADLPRSHQKKQLLSLFGPQEEWESA